MRQTAPTLLFSFLLFFLSIQAFSQVLPSPKEHFGFSIGDDYQLATYTQTAAYFQRLAASNRTKLVNMGPTEEGRPQYMVIVSSPQNIRDLDKYKTISQQLARAENLTEEQAKTLAATGRAVVWIDGGLHATEVVGTHQLIESLYQFVSRNDPETVRILDSVIILFVHANPDGQEIVSNWYMQEKDLKKRNTNIPRLYEKYIGHDNNRDFYMMNVKETQNISRQQYLEWFPQIIYNHHQTGPAGSVLSGPPYRDPFNFVYDPLVITGIEALGAAMENRLNRENKPGYTKRAGSVYSTWWNGGLRTTAYFHNMIGLLTEIIGNPTPAKVPLVTSRLVPNDATPFPVTPQEWRFKQSIDYSVSLNYAVLNYATNQKAELLYGIYRMGKNSIERGSRDNWTLSPRKIDSLNNLVKKYQKDSRPATASAVSTIPDSLQARYFAEVLSDKSLRDPRGYIIPADQTDYPTAVRFVNALLRSGVLVHRATKAFSVAGKQYPAGSYIVKTAQAFRPHVLDLFEPQDHPNDFAYPGGPPVRPYDATGWTLAYTMGIAFDRQLDDFEGPFERIPYGEWQTAASVVPQNASGYGLAANVNASFIAVNDLLQAGQAVYRSGDGSFYVPATAKAKLVLQKTANETGVPVSVASKKGRFIKVKPLRIGLWDQYGGSMASGWVRWLLEQYHFSATIVYPKTIDSGNLRQNFDLLLFVDGAIAAPGTTTFNRQPKADAVPAEYHNRLGRVSADTSVPQLRKFLEEGGQVVTIGSSTALAYHLKLPVRNALVEMTAGGEKPLPNDKFYIPGSVLRMKTVRTGPASWGIPSEVDVYFDESPVFKPAPEALANGTIQPIGWFNTDQPLRSGWAWGQAYLKDGMAAFSAPVGKGRFYAFGPEITFRGQTHGTFRFLFNTLFSQP